MEYLALVTEGSSYALAGIQFSLDDAIPAGFDVDDLHLAFSRQLDESQIPALPGFVPGD